MIGTRAIVMVLLALAAVGVPTSRSQELTINRPKPEPATEQDNGIPAGWVKVSDDLYRAHFRVPGDFLSSGVPDPAEDPFGGGGESLNDGDLMTAQEILEEVGVPFGEGAYAHYSGELRTLTVVNTLDALSLILVYLDVLGPCYEPQVSIRTEIYEVSSASARQLVESAELEIDHSPEREAVLKAVRDGKAELVAIHSLSTILGMRAKIEDVTECQLEGASKEKSSSRSYGTILEVEPVNGWNGIGLQLDLVLEHHTAEPEIRTLPGGMNVQRFHAKKIKTTVDIGVYGCVLLGAWKPTGKPEYAETDVRHVVFVTASRQVVE